MFELSVSKQDLLTPLSIVSGAIGKKQTNLILSHVLLSLAKQTLTCTATDLEIEITARIACQAAPENSGDITIPAKKCMDIVRLLEDQSEPVLRFDGELFSIREKRSLFKLATLPAQDYPRMEDEACQVELQLDATAFTRLLQLTHFALAQNDVRFFLNSLFLEIEPEGVTAVGTDGHRMAIAFYPMQTNQSAKLLIPRRAISELLRLVTPLENKQISLSASQHFIRVISDQYTLTSKLLDSRFPAYKKAIPKNHDKVLLIDRDLLKRALSRMMILAHEKSKAIILHLQSGLITLLANNQEKEEAIESIEAQTTGDELKVGINALYLLDVLNVLPEGLVQLSFYQPDSSILVFSPVQADYQYIIMPMKL